MNPRRVNDEVSWVRKNLGLTVQTVVLCTSGLGALMAYSRGLENRLTANENAIHELGDKYDTAIKTEIGGLRDWLKSVSDRTHEIERDVSHLRGATGIPKSASINSYRVDPKPTASAGSGGVE